MRRGIKMNAINDLINADQKQIIRRPLEHGQVMPNADRNQGRFRLIASNPIDKIEFTRHGPTC